MKFFVIQEPHGPEGSLLIPRHNPDAQTPQDVYNVLDSIHLGLCYDRYNGRVWRSVVDWMFDPIRAWSVALTTTE